MARRPATLEDMVQFWPDKSPEELKAIFDSIQADDRIEMTIVTREYCGHRSVAGRDPEQTVVCVLDPHDGDVLHEYQPVRT